MVQEKKKWSHGPVIDYECARETIGDMISIYVAQIAEEENKPNPDQSKLDELEAVCRKLGEERNRLHVDDQVHVKRINDIYGAKVRAWRDRDRGCA